MTRKLTDRLARLEGPTDQMEAITVYFGKRDESGKHGEAVARIIMVPGQPAIYEGFGSIDMDVSGNG